LFITTPLDKDRFINLLGNGNQLGCEFKYIDQKEPRGLADAYILGERFIGNNDVCMILGDNIFYGGHLDNILIKLGQSKLKFANIFAYPVSNPKRYGIVEFNSVNKVISLEEKPSIPKSNYAQTGIYFTDSSVVEIAKNIEPSQRGELEVTDVMKKYLLNNKLKATILDKGTVWLDTGTIDSMISATEYVKVIEKRQDIKIGCIEEIAFKKGYINAKQLEKLARPLLKSGYGEYLFRLLNA